MILQICKLLVVFVNLIVNDLNAKNKIWLKIEKEKLDELSREKNFHRKVE